MGRAGDHVRCDGGGDDLEDRDEQEAECVGPVLDAQRPGDADGDNAERDGFGDGWVRAMTVLKRNSPTAASNASRDASSSRPALRMVPMVVTCHLAVR